MHRTVTASWIYGEWLLHSAEANLTDDDTTARSHAMSQLNCAAKMVTKTAINAVPNYRGINGQAEK